MSEADELKAEINVAIDLEERARGHIVDSLDAIEQLQSQLLLIGISSESNDDLQNTIRRVTATHQVINGASTILVLIRESLEDWRDRL